MPVYVIGDRGSVYSFTNRLCIKTHDTNEYRINDINVNPQINDPPVVSTTTPDLISTDTDNY